MTAERLDGVRFGVPPELTGDGVEPGVRAVFEAALARIEELGGSVTEVPLPHSGHAISAYYVLAPAEASANLARFDGVRYGRRAAADGDLLSLYEQTREEGFGPEVKRRIMLGTYALLGAYGGLVGVLGILCVLNPHTLLPGAVIIYCMAVWWAGVPEPMIPWAAPAAALMAVAHFDCAWLRYAGYRRADPAGSAARSVSLGAIAAVVLSSSLVPATSDGLTAPSITLTGPA